MDKLYTSVIDGDMLLFEVTKEIVFTFKFWEMS